MATNFPTSLDNSTSLPYPSASNNTNNPSLASGQDNQNDAIIAIETKIGTGSATPTNNKFFVGTGTGTSGWSNTLPAGTVVGTSDSQTLTNKTLTSPTINSPTIANATLSSDAITGYSVVGNGTIYGLGINSGVLQTANSITNTVIKSGELYSSKFYAPYKFSVYRNAAWTSVGSGTPALVAFDAKDFDTGNNIDVVTNKGRFTAPIAGFYHFNAAASWGATTIGIVVYVSLYKNGIRVKDGNWGQTGAASSNIGGSVSDTLSLAANDYIEIYSTNGGSNAAGMTGTNTHFSGFLVSGT